MLIRVSSIRNFSLKQKSFIGANLKKRFYNSVFTLVLLLTSINFSQNFSSEEIKNYLDAKEKVFEDISIQMGIANWNVYSQEGEADQDTPKQRYFELFNDEVLQNNINTWYSSLDKIKDKLLSRRVEMWHNILTGASVDMNEKVFKLENKLEAIIAESETENNAGDEILQLMKLRNEKSKEAGYNNYAEMMIELNYFDMDDFNAFYEEMNKKTEEPYRKLLEELERDATVNDIRRFVGMFYRNSGATGIDKDKQMDLLKETLANIGFNFDELPIRFVEKEIPYGGNSIAVKIPGDMRIIMNVGMPMGVWMHEVGHGLHGVCTTIESTILKGYEWNLGAQCSAFGEGMAEVGAGFIRNNEWQKKYSGLTEKEIIVRFEEAKKYFPAYIRYWFTTVMFEVELYKDLSQDPQELRDEIYKELLFVDASDTPFSMDGNIMYVSYPVYYQNYVFAAIVALQVHKALEKKFGKDYMFNKDVGPWLVENLYSDGEFKFWKDKLKIATGKEFDVEGYFAYYGL